MASDVWAGVESPLASYIGRTVDEDELMECASGGVFSAIARSVINRGGVVFGAAFADGCVRHEYATNVAGIERFRGSKYVQSDLGDSFLQVRNFLKGEREVLFSGTPCQIAGLRSFLTASHLGKETLANLGCIDFVCHGVGSPMVFASYLDGYAKEGMPVCDLNMRSKHFGYRIGCMRVDSTDGSRRFVSTASDFYLKAFFSDRITRPCCHDCAFKGVRHDSDITVWDSWEAEDILGIRHDNKGFTNIIIQSPRGKDLLGGSNDNLRLWRVGFGAIRPKRGGMMLFSSPASSDAERFMEVTRNMGLDVALDKYMPVTLLDSVKEGAKVLLARLGIIDIFSRAKRKFRRLR